MENVITIAKYIFTRYKADYGVPIDEMKLHKLLYFAQREALIQIGKPLFKENFVGWKFGPVMLKIRKAYKNEQLDDADYQKIGIPYQSIMDYVFNEYAQKDSWSLSRLSHGEFSWKQSRTDIQEGENGNVKIKLKDIKKDANRIKKRRELLVSLSRDIQEGITNGDNS